MFPLAGDQVDELPDIGGVVSAAHSALAESLGHLRSGGSPTDGFVTGRMGKIKPAIDAAGKVAARSGKSGATLRVTASADDGGYTAGVSLVIVFCGLEVGLVVPGHQVPAVEVHPVHAAVAALEDA